LDGVPISIKSNIAMRDFNLTANSKILSNVVGYDALLVQKLKDAGAIIIGQTNMDEFGMGSLGNNCNTSNDAGTSTSNSNSTITDNSSRSGRSYTINPLPSLMEYRNEYKMETYANHVRRMEIPESITDMIVDLDDNDDDDNGSTMPHYSPGGSSSGSAASVSIGSSILSIGTDTGGSVRLPASWCGVVGLKPTYGAISRDGVVSYASSLDTVGILGASVECVASTLDIIRNDNASVGKTMESVRDSTACFLDPIPGWKDNASSSTSSSSRSSSSSPSTSDDNNDDLELSGITIGIPAAFSVETLCNPSLSAWDKSIQWLEDCGATIQIIDETIVTPNAVKMSLPAYYVLSSAEASSNLARYDGLRYGMSCGESMGDSSDASKGETMDTKMSMNTREEQYASARSHGFGKEVQRRILAGTAVLSSDRFHSHYEAATKARATILKQLNSAFNGDAGVDDEDNVNCNPSVNTNGVDLMLIPTQMSMPPDLNPAAEVALDSTAAFRNDIMTVPISLAGLPAISVPVMVEDGDGSNSDSCPYAVVGMQVFGPKLSEKLILRAAHTLRHLY